MATLQNIQAKIAKLEAQAKAVTQKQSSGALEKIRNLMQKHGVSIADIESFVAHGTRGRKVGSTVATKSQAGAAKYRDPKSGATWTGHGRAPAWIAKAKDRNRFLIDAATAIAAVAPVKAAAKAGNYVRGPQPAKYQDPKSGATWSGRGRAPAWIAGAKDLTKFLIGEAGAAAEAKPKAASKSVAGRKATSAKAASLKSTAAKGATKTAASKTVEVEKKTTVKKVTAKKAVAKKAAAKKPAAKAEQAVKKVTATKGPAPRKVAKKAPAKAALPVVADQVVDTQTATAEVAEQTAVTA
ncbi:H-NS family nucleoid-associated regulatory protein [Paraburkholderia sp. J67]|uniref:H-NS family nucleoid-associated regulatory protein n=1 Tax=Paraburkholderia sp. J67 TaxID=2805435 RepID=UPI002ABE2363|nr:H-NS family nucleoid-associated regulatory protein [Paraburkholderia sp. J67]